jgi:hypothetical protein
MKTKEEFLTIEEAVSQGYSLCGVKGKEFQHFHTISELNEEDFEECDFVLASKEEYTLGISADDLCDMVTDHVVDSNELADDTNGVPDLLKSSVPWEEISQKINSVLVEHKYYFLTEINLVP